MKIFALIFFLLFVVGGILFAREYAKRDDSSAVKAYIDSHGAAPIPSSWRGKIGKGI